MDYPNNNRASYTGRGDQGSRSMAPSSSMPGPRGGGPSNNAGGQAARPNNIVPIREECMLDPDEWDTLLCPDIPPDVTGGGSSNSALPELSCSSFSALSLDDDEDSSQHWEIPRSPPPASPRAPSPPSQAYKKKEEQEQEGGEMEPPRYPTTKRKILQKIEVAPGVSLRLRGATETWEAIERDFYGPSCCFACETTIFCIDDADYVLCPNCRVVGPYESISNARGLLSGGVGLGFTMEQLAQWQGEMRRDRDRRGMGR